MKTKIIVLAALCLLIIIAGIFLYNNYQNLPINGTLNINGKDITNENVMLHKNNVELPLTKVLEALGFNLEWIDDNNAKLTYNDKNFYLDISRMSLLENGSDINILRPALGTTLRVCKSIDKDIILDIYSIRNSCSFMDIDICFEIDRENSYIYITEKMNEYNSTATA